MTTLGGLDKIRRIMVSVSRLGGRLDVTNAEAIAKEGVGTGNHRKGWLWLGCDNTVSFFHLDTLILHIMITLRDSAGFDSFHRNERALSLLGQGQLVKGRHGSEWTGLVTV